MERVSDHDALLIARQIGRTPRGEYTIERRCPHGYPQVLRVPPWVEGEPFPTLYWLCCPFLVGAVGRLEAEGWVRRLEERAAAEPELRAGLDRAHDGYIAERRQLIACPDGSIEAEQLNGRGIGGITNRARLKCLHLHVAHALARENPIGDLVLAMLSETACGREKKICSSLCEREEQI